MQRRSRVSYDIIFPCCSVGLIICVQFAKLTGNRLSKHTQINSRLAWARKKRLLLPKSSKRSVCLTMFAVEEIVHQCYRLAMPVRSWQTQKDGRCAMFTAPWSLTFDSSFLQEYDVHGVWPPPEPTSDEDSDPFFDHMQGHASHGFSSPFFTSHSHQFRSTNFFRDPLELFDSIFRDFDDLFMTEAAPSTQTFTPFSPLGSLGSQRPRGMFNFDDPFFGPTPGLLSTVPIFPPMLTSSFAQGSGREHGRGYQVRTESYVSHTVNGVSQSTHTRRDGDVSYFLGRWTQNHSTQNYHYLGKWACSAQNA